MLAITISSAIRGLTAGHLARRLPAVQRVFGHCGLPLRTPVKNALPVERTLASSASPYAAKWFYAVRKGRTPGVYTSWDDAKAQVSGFAGAEHQKFSSAEAAHAYQQGDFLLGPVSSPERLVVYTDGSCTSDGKGGFGAYFAADETPDICERVPSFLAADGTIQPTFNDKTELYAIVRVLEVDPDPSRELHFHCDATYVIDTFNSRQGAAPARHANLKNLDMIKYIQELIDNRPKAVKFFHVKGHAGIPGNVEADKLAAKGTTLDDIPSRDFRADLRAYQAKVAKQKHEDAAKAERKILKAMKPMETMKKCAKKSTKPSVGKPKASKDVVTELELA